MKNRKVFAIILSLVLVIAMMPSMAFAIDTGTPAPETGGDQILIAPAPDADKTTDTAAPAKSNDIVILGTSDVHCGIDENIGYAGLAAYKKAMQAEYNYVTLVDAGDAIQGDTIGTLSKGEYLVSIMNNVGYDIAVPGNHEFDYGMDQFLNVIVKNAKATYVSANFMKEGKTVFDPYVIKEYGDKKVAFVGVSTPETLVKSTPTYFQDSKGNYIYDFCNDKTGEKFYAAAQTAVDAAKKAGADYVVAVVHLGDDINESSPWTSTELIQNTTGIDVLMDGHAHALLTTSVKNKAGKNVKMVATGTKLEHIGKIVIAADGVITVENIGADIAKDKDADTAAFIDGIKAKYAELEAKVVATTDVDLITHDEDDNRLVRSQETNLGDLCADAYKAMLGADLAFVNGGGIRAELDKGNITYGDIIKVHPYGNSACLIEATGQQILDALEFGASKYPSENGGFLQVAGVTYEINPFVNSSIVMNEASEFVKVAGEYRVSNVMIGGQPLELDKTYKLASHNYMLKSGGDGFVMFKGNTILQDEVMIDNQVLINYIQQKLGGKVGAEYAAPQGRIKIKTADEAIAPIVAQLKAAEEKLAIAEYECKVKIKTSKKSIKLTWNACEAEGVEYQVYRSTKSSSGFKKVKTTSKTSFTTTSVKKGTKYYFKVRAIKKIDGKTYYGHWSNKVNGKRG